MDSLYRAVFVVTGTGEANRRTGFAQCLGDVLVKLTGDQTILEDPRLPEFAGQAASFVESFGYRDRFEGMPLRDEQGSYDRPHNLTVAFDRARIDALADTLGRKPWLSQRPRVVAVVAVENVNASFMLASDGTIDRSADMRAALTAAAERVTLPLTLPARAALDRRGVTTKTLPDAASADASVLARDSGADVALVGRMSFSEQAFGWIADWRVEHDGRMYAWSVRGVNFDEAFRNAMRGAAQVLSGHGTPK
jgi:hypothetical protein